MFGIYVFVYRSIKYIVPVISGIQPPARGDSNASTVLKEATSMRSEDELDIAYELDISVRNLLLSRFII